MTDNITMIVLSSFAATTVITNSANESKDYGDRTVPWNESFPSLSRSKAKEIQTKFLALSQG